MFKILGGVVLGIFVGALVLEVMRRRRPDIVEAIEKKAKDFTQNLLAGIGDGRDSGEEEA